MRVIRIAPRVLRTSWGVLLTAVGLAGIPLAAAGQLGSAVGFGGGLTGNADAGVGHVMAAVRVSPRQLQPASIRLDGALMPIASLSFSVVNLSTLVPATADTAATTVPYLLLGVGMMSDADHRRGTANLGVGLVAGRGVVRPFFELRAYSIDFPRLSGTIGFEF
jgi:hypothetical protein